MRPYLDLLDHILTRGERVPTRAVLPSSGAKLRAVSVVGCQFRCDLAEGFPLLTTKKMHFRGIAEELLWMLRGETNIGPLNRAGVTIWDDWGDPETGDLGPVYGRQWRDQRGVDQLARLRAGIARVAADPAASEGRRLVVSLWNAADLPAMRLPPCHGVGIQFLVRAGRLSCVMFQRSADALLGVPYNIASYALLTHLLARDAGALVPGELVISFGDLHLYENHLDLAREQLRRVPRPLPTLWIDPAAPRDPAAVTTAHLRIDGYDPHPAIRAEVAV